ncbi:MAG: cytochrome c1 [Sphingomonas sp.]|nr:cytochrome c1 [Sphingomonas sp.]RZV51573.1 MAG: cytochrome c1 [Sphingomonadaceae bacterium]
MGDILKLIGVRGFAFLLGIGFVLILLWSFQNDLRAYFSSEPPVNLEYAFHKEPKDVSFTTDGVLAHWDKAQLQRGYQVYDQVCAACHGLQYVNFRNLEDLGYSEEAVKAIAAQKNVADIDEVGQPGTRPGKPSDAFPSPYPNEIAARAANNNAYPPDLSLITKARSGGAPYIYSLLTGYTDHAGYTNKDGEVLPESAYPTPGTYFNPYFKNLNIAMAPPLVEGIVTYEGANAPEATAEQMAKDVAAFLIWTAEPSLVDRKRTGAAVLIFLLLATIFAFFAYRNVWATAKRDVAMKGPLDPENMALREEAKDEAAEEGRGVKG